MASVFAGAKTCIPSPATVGDPADPMHQLGLALDAFDGHLVACAQVPTRRGVSVFFDLVSYACWNVDPATAKLERRLDLARAYFDCASGCDDNSRAVAYDGKTVVTYAAGKLAIAPRAADGTAGAVIRTLPAPAGLGDDDELLRGDLIALPHAIAVHVGGEFVVIDDSTGTELARAPGIAAGVVDDTHLLVLPPPPPGTDEVDAPPSSPPPPPPKFTASLIDVAHKKITHLTLPDNAIADVVSLAGKTYAIAGRTLLELDAATFAVKSHRALPACP